MSLPSIQPPALSQVEGLVPRSEFPIFAAHPELVYLDSAATTQKPRAVLEAERRFYETSNANVHRGIYVLAEQATAQYEAARATVARFIGGQSNEVVFTSGATAAINLVAQSFVRPRLMQTRGHSGSGAGNHTPGVKEGLPPQIIVTIAEHHSNFVPWQQLCQETGATFTVVPLKGMSSLTGRSTGSGIQLTKQQTWIPDQVRNDDLWELDLEFLERALQERPTALVAVAHVGNVLGTINPIREITDLAHAHGVPVLVDAAQSLAHRPIDVTELGADFLVGSAHKAYGPTGIGFLWAQREHLEGMEPSQFGGEMIRSVTIDEATWNDVPWKFEAGTPNIAGAIGFAAALEWLSGRPPVRGHTGSELGNDTPGVKENWRSDSLDWHQVTYHEERLLTYATEQLRTIDGLTILGPSDPRDRAGVISFVINEFTARLTPGVKSSKTPGVGEQWIHPHDLVSILDEQSVELRAGRHCAQPLHDAFGLAASARISFGVYSSSEDIDRLIAGIRSAQRMLHAA